MCVWMVLISIFQGCLSLVSTKVVVMLIVQLEELLLNG